MSGATAAAYRPVVDVLRGHAADLPDRTALVVLGDGQTETARLSYAELDARARTLAARMQRAGLAGERVIIALPTSAEYVLGFLACLYAGAVAVPLNPPTKSIHGQRIDHVVADCRPALAIVAADGRLAHLPAEYGCQLWTAGDLASWTAGDLAATGSGALDAAGGGTGQWRAPAYRPDDPAYLQYTSGSTSQPRGVVVTQENLIHQPGLFSTGLGLDGDDVVLSWLPLFHDFGLIAGLLMPLLLGGTTVLMPPTAFAQRPLLWLEAVTRYRATTSFSPNFPLDLCVERITEAEKQDLDLSRWRVLALGAEPIRPDTLERFAAAFAGCGFRTEAFRMAYGLAESTPAVAVQPGRPAPRVVEVDAEKFGDGVVEVVPAGTAGRRRQRLISNGPAQGDTELLVVDPQTRAVLPEGREGEVWLRGRTVAAGYWQRPAETEETFGARLADGDGDGPWLRSGDLGVLLDGEVFLTSRRKDLIIIRGRNHHPQDIELTVTDAHPALARGRGVAFSVEVDGEERLVVAQEFRRTERRAHDPEEVARRIRGAVAEEHDVAVDTVVFLRPGSLPVTTSGKVRRQYTRRCYLGDGLEVDHRSHSPLPSSAPTPAETPPTETPSTGATPAETPSTGPATAAPEAVPATGPAGFAERRAVVAWLRERVATLAGLTADRVDAGATFGSLGLDSATVLRLSGDLAAWRGHPVEPTLLYSHPTIRELATAVTTGTAPAGRPGAVAPTGPSGEPVAVVGMACAFPSAGSVEEFWTLLMRGVDAVTEIPPTRWITDRTDRTDPPSTGPTRWGGLLDDVSGFDARFFGVSAEEAAAMDPQQRLLLTTVWRALEDAGIGADTLAGTDCGVFVGIATNDYRQLMVRDHVLPGPYTGTGTALSVAAGRISYFLDLNGPSVALDTACSSSLVAVHEASESLRRGECDTAIVAGVNLLLDDELSDALTEAGMLSPTGRCRTFDGAADGYVRGEGCGVVVLRRHSAALRDGDRVHALVAGTAVNQDGHSNTLTAPNALAQQAVMRRALAAAGVTAAQVGYVEAHGTGTRLGDPIEMAGIQAVYGAPTGGPPLHVGSVKTNIGHLEAAAGVAGLIKAVLAVRHGVVPAHLHLDRLNPMISLDGTRCRIPTRAEPFSGDPERPRVAAVSSFGFSGTNAHVIVRSAPASAAPAVDVDTDAWRILPISARSEWARTELLDATAALLDTAAVDGSPSFAGICRSATRRTRLPHRTTVVARTAAEAAEALREHRAGRRSAYVTSGTVRDDGPGPVAWLLPGQGFQRVGMAAAFQDRYDVFRDTLAACDAIVRADRGVSLLPTLTGAPGELVDLDDTRMAQPAMFAVQYALARLWQAAGVTPDHLLGHSLGEYAAACLAGVLSLDDALGLVLLRSRLMFQTPPGVMYAVRSDRSAELLDELRDPDGAVVVAAVNSPQDVTISGTAEAAEAVAQRWLRRGARVTRLAINRACHSPLMQSAVDEFARQAAAVPHQPARIPMVSSLTGEILGGQELTGEYWVRQLRRPVLFADALRTLDRLGVRHFVELSPEAVLSPLGPRTLTEGTWLTSGQRDEPTDRQLLLSLAQWHTLGGRLEWSALAGGAAGPAPAPVRLPGHPLRPVHHWYTPGVSRRPRGGSGRAHPLLGERVDLAGASAHWFGTELEHTRPWFVDEHRVGDVPVLPGAAMIEWAVAAGRATFGDGPAWTLDDVRFTTALALPPGRTAPVQAVVDPATGAVECFARDGRDEPWVRRVHVGAVRPGAAEPPADWVAPPWRDRVEPQDVAALYDRLADAGLRYGPAFRAVRQLWRHDAEAVARITVDAAGRVGDESYLAHPVVLDGCFHVAAAFLTDLSRPVVPVAVDSVTIYDRLPADVWCQARSVGTRGGADQVVDLTLAAVDGTPVLVIRGLTLRALPSAALAPALPLRRYLTRWVPAPEVFAGTELTGTWIVCTPDPEVARTWRTEVTAAHPAVTVVVLGDDPADTVEDALREAGRTPESVTGIVVPPVVARGADPASADPAVPEGPDADRSAAEEVLAGHAALLHGVVLPLGRILPAVAASRPTVILCSRRAFAPPGGAPELAQSALTGLTQALTAEYPDLRVVQVDGDGSTPKPLEILARATAAPTATQLTLHDGRWQELRLVAETAGVAEPASAGLRADATYLVTGGWGALGRVTAQCLVAAGARHLVLVGRRIPAPLPGWLADLTDQGVEVVLREVDVADDAALGALIAEIRQRMPVLRGVVHAAGGTHDAPLPALTGADFTRVLAPKAWGAWHLHRHTADLPLDFFLLFSSLASLVGSAGQANYVLANAFLDALAELRTHHGLAASSLNWGPWSEGGIAARDDLLGRMARAGLVGITDAEGAAALTTALATRPVRVGLAKVDWARYVAATPRGVPYALLGEVAPAVDPAAGSGAPVPDLGALALTDPAAAEAELTTWLLHEVSVLLGLGPADREELRAGFADSRFSMLGLDSLMTVRLGNRMLSEVSVQLPNEALVDGRTVAEVVRELCGQLAAGAVVGEEGALADEDTEVLVL